MVSYSYTKQDVDYSFLLFDHLLRMSKASEEIVQMAKPSAAKLASFRNQVKWFETLIVPFLDQLYVDKLNEFGLKATKAPPSGNNFEENAKYFDKINKWAQVLMIYAYNNRLLRVRKRFISHAELEKFIDTGTLEGVEREETS